MIKKISLVFFLFSFCLFGETVLEESFGKDLKVGLKSQETRKIYIKVYYGDVLVIADGLEKELEKGSYFEMEYRNKKLSAYGKTFESLKILKKDVIALIGISKDGKNFKKYRGDFYFKISNSKILPINTIKVEEYLYSVVPSEIGNNFPNEAIKAQAVASRTYLFYSLKNKKYSDFDLMDDTSSQMYLGYDKENDRINELVNQTKGKVIFYKGNPINALYHSTSGGKTAGNENVWGGEAIPYLRSVDDEENYKKSPRATWYCKLSKKEISKKIGFNVEKIEIEEKIEERVKKVKIYGEKDIILTGNELRAKLGYNEIFSTVFNISENGGNYIFKGKGSGHGVGMSQWGAYGLAEKGFHYEQILEYYYNDVEIKDVEKIRNYDIIIK